MKIYQKSQIFLITGTFKYLFFRKTLTDFLENKLSDCKLEGIIDDDLSYKFKYASIKYRLYDKKNENIKKKVTSHYKSNFIVADLVITRKTLFILDYNKNKRRYEILFIIKLENLIKLSVNKNNTNCFIIYDKVTIQNGLEIMSESCKSILPLIDDLYQSNTSKANVVVK